MPVAAAFPVWLVVCLFAFLAMSGVVTAGILEVGPDAFPEGIVLNNVFPGVTLSNETVRGDPDQTDVLARSGTTLLGPTAGQNVASTGELVFGRESAPGPSDSLIFWSGVPFAPTVDSAVLWANFHIVEALSVEVDARANDNDVFELRAFDASDNEVSPPGVSAGGTNVLLPMNITSSSPTSPQIAYILAYGVPAQDGAGLLDNMRVEFLTLPVFIDIKPKDDQNRINICTKGNLPVAILSFDNFSVSGGTYFDANQVDPLTADLGGAGVRRIGKDEERGLHKIEDVNGDGLLDMVVMIVQEDLGGIDSNTSELTLTGSRNDSTAFVGSDAVEVQQHMCVRTLE